MRSDFGGRLLDYCSRIVELLENDVPDGAILEEAQQLRDFLNLEFPRAETMCLPDSIDWGGALARTAASYAKEKLEEE